MNRHSIVLALISTLALASVAACGDDEGTGAVTTKTNTSSSSGQGGAGGSAGAGGDGASGGAGGGAGGCLPASVHEDLFAVTDPSLCVVASYDADAFVGTDVNFFASAPTWGAHGGPLLVRSGPAGMEDNLQLIRLSVVGDQLVSAITVADLTIAAGFFLGSQAIEVPGTSWTLVSWTGAGGVGEVVAIDNGSQADAFPMVGFFSGATVGTADNARIIHTGLSALGNGDPNQSASAAYAADFCAGPSVCNNGAIQLAAWGTASGAVASDQDGNAFVILTDPAFLGGNDTQTLRGFGATAVAHGSGPTSGTDMFTMDGFGYALAASSPNGGEPGVVMYQPFDATTFSALDVVAQHYGVAGDEVVAQGAPIAALTMTTAGSEVVLVSDPAGRIWVGHGLSEVPASSRWFVIDRAR